MQEPEHSRPTGPSSRRVPTGDLVASLHDQVAGVLRVLESASAEAKLDRRTGRERLLELFEGHLEGAMLALGETLAAFLYGDEQPVDFERLRTDFLEPILSLSRSSPLFNRAEEWARDKDRTGELHPLLLQGRAVGFDAKTLLLDNFYQNTIFAHALRTRVASLARLFLAEAERQHDAGVRVLRVLVLGANSILQIGAPFAKDPPSGDFSVLIADGDTNALRLARQRFEETFRLRPDVLRVSPEALAKSRRRISQPFDIVYSLMQYDMHSPQTALDLTRGLCEMLRPGGVLLTGCFLPTVPPSYRALAVAFADLEWQYWDEARWKELLGRLPFDLSAGRFEMVPPATIAVLARRSGSEAPR